MNKGTIHQDPMEIVAKEHLMQQNTTMPPSNASEILWNGMKKYYDMGISMIWARTEMEIVGDEEKAPKSPLGKWRSAQTIRYTEDALSKMMLSAKVAIAPAMITGKISGNLEIIDIDVKHWPGIDARFFSECRAIFPALFDRLLIHQTGSKGAHIIYRCEEPIAEGNRKLASQLGSTKAGIETRGEGGYALCPPGAGYTVIQDRPIPVLTRAERDAIITLCLLFDEKVKVVAPRKVREHDSVYDENPYQHFNSSTEAERLLDVEGWKLVEPETNQFAHYTRPGKQAGISASFIKDKRRYHIFTSSTALESDKTYDPAALLTALQFQNDYKRSFRYLVDKGFGKVKPYYEQKVVKAYAQDKDKELPANFSQEAKEALLVERTKRDILYPHGTYWIHNKDSDSYSISFIRLINTANSIGIARYQNKLVKVEGNHFQHIEEAEALNILCNYIQEEEVVFFKIVDALMAKWKQYCNFFATRQQLREITRSDILCSSERIYYKVFLNGVLEITRDKIEMIESTTKYDKLIDKDLIIKRVWKRVPESEYKECMYVRYLRKAISTDWKYVQKAIGYAVYDYKTRGKGYILALLEGMQRGKGGGSGKGMFFEMLGDPISARKTRETMKWTTVISISGRQMEKGEAEMLQMWAGERIVHFSDAPKNLNLSDIKDVATDGGAVKKLYQDVHHYEAMDYPNIGISSQWGINVDDDPGVARRLRILTFTDYFNKDREVRDEFGGTFPDIWSEADWDGYYSYIAEGVQAFMASGHKLEDTVEGDMMWEKKFDHTYGMGRDELRYWIGDMASKWCKWEHIRSSELQSSYEKFCIENNIKREMSIPRLHDALTAWSERNGFEYEKSVRKRVEGEQIRCSILRRGGVVGEEC